MRLLRLYGDWTSYELTAPAQTKYPLSFLAEINNPTATIVVNGARTSAPVLTLAIFEKSSASASWVITRIVTTGNTAPWLSPTSSSTMAATPQPEPSQFVMGFSQLVAAMTSARNIGRVSPDNYWSRVGANEEPGAMFQELEGDHQADVAGHSTQVGGYTYSAPSAVFMTKLGPMECAYVLGTATYRGPNVEQPANRSAFGPFLAPGTYQSVTLESTRDACIVQETPTYEVFVGIYGGVSDAIGVPVASSV